jgi:riboflavin kinase/FMN adenylyltransferase
MKIITNSIQAKNIQNAVVTIGTFDGVHIGHQAIFKEMRRIAQEIGGETVVVTFHPHPRQVLSIGTERLRFICSQEDKLKKIDEFGIDNVVIIPFTKEFASTPSDEFIKNYIIDRIHPAVIVVGYDHHFGKNRMGDYEMLCQLGNQYGFETVQVEAQDINEVAVSSTKIRNFLWAGNVKAANELLGYPYSVTGTVVVGNRIGRTIGFPTANLDIPNEFMMINNPGVYACRTMIDGKSYQAMANTGLRPTIKGLAESGALKTENSQLSTLNSQLLLEVNIFDFDGDLYGKTLKVWFLDRIRDEEKFKGLEALKAQLEQDREKVKEYFLNNPSK